ncbi:MAG: S8 family serine peptidase, partial [Acidobacteria bacterium]|nr:S8 family serine peptidase [Acidobacteriota bacterium]
VITAFTGNQSPQTLQPAGQRKIAPWVIERTASGKPTEFLVILADKADLSGVNELKSKLEKGRLVRNALFAKAQQTQAPLLAWLRARGVEHRSFYIVNAIWVRATRAVALSLAARPEVARIEGNPSIRNLAPVKPTEAELQAALNAVASPQAPQAIEPGVSYIRAPEVWAQGFTGQGIVIGGADTGVEWNHPALKNHYRGWNGLTANHNYNWHDSIHTGGGVCGPNAVTPCDDNNHGTHTLGSAVGDDGASNQIGVAPGAKFIACRNMDQGNGTPATYLECMEWFLAPYPVGGTPSQGDATKAPDITTNSWGCPPSEGCSQGTLQTAIEAQRTAGIMTVVAAGNSGSACSTIVDPPSHYDAAYTVGAISSATGLIATFSSRGPITIDGSNRRKPDITAPGVAVRSAVRGGGYSSFNGTSMATPHVAGAVALLWSAHAALRHQITDTENFLNEAAVDVTSTSCSSSGVPNNVYGFGRLDIKAAVDLAGAATLNITSVAPPAGRTSGNQSVVLTGAFANLATVMIGGNAATWFYSNGTSEITVITPAHAVGAVSIGLTPTSGTPHSKANAFAYLPTVFADDALVVGMTTAKALHIIELRNAVDSLRLVAGLGLAPWTDTTLLPTSTVIKAIHITELRTHLENVAALLGYAAGSYTDAGLGSGFVIKRVHIEELRQRIRALAG